MTDGPFVETREVLGGYYLFHARDLSDAITIAARHPGAKVGMAEFRKTVVLLPAKTCDSDPGQSQPYQDSETATQAA